MHARMWKLAALTVVAAVVAGLVPHVPIAPANNAPGQALAAAPSPLEEALAGKYKGTRVLVNGIYGGSWGVDYQGTLQAFADQSGIEVLYFQRDESGDLFISDVEAGKGPDIMDFSWLSPVKRFAREGKIVDLAKVVDMETLRSRYDPKWIEWATVDGPDGPIVGGLWSNFLMHSLVWYPKAAFDQAGYKVPTTWAELLALSDQIVKDGGTPWCIENGNDGEWPGFAAAFWLDDLLLRTIPAADYDLWRKGELPADSPQVRKALQTMSDLWFKPGYVLGGRKAINETRTWEVARPMFDTPPKCWLLKQPNWMLDYNQMSGYTSFTDRKYGQDYDFFVLPPVDKAGGTPVQMEGHITAMLHDRPEVRALMEWLTTGAQVERWIKLGHHAGFSPNKDAQLGWYTNERDRKLAGIAADALKAGDLRFTAVDSMWPAVNDQVYQSLTAYVAGDIDMDTALKQIDAARAAIGAPAPGQVTRVNLHDVWGASGSDVFAVGDQGTVLRYDGKTWSSMTSGTSVPLHDVWAGPGDAFAVGEIGAILHYDGQAWKPMESSTPYPLYGVWARSPANAFAAGLPGTILHYDGNDWLAMGSFTLVELKGVWGPGTQQAAKASTAGPATGEVFVVGDSGTILHYDGSTWSSMKSGTPYNFNTPWGTSGDDVYAVGDRGTVLHYDGNSWSPMTSGTSSDLFGLWGTSDSDVFAVGSTGTILHYDGKAWSRMPSGTTRKLNSVWGDSPSDVYAVGDAGTILHYDGKAWSPMAGGGG